MPRRPGVGNRRKEPPREMQKAGLLAPERCEGPRTRKGAKGPAAQAIETIEALIRSSDEENSVSPFPHSDDNRDSGQNDDDQNARPYFE